jgi:eukaryotic-like serine/threonine-protein kinase
MRKLSDDPELEKRVRARIGTTLRGKYRVDDVLGIGGMAAVYSATHRNGRRVAVKLLHPELALSTEAKSRFLREGLVANTVRHPGVVTILDDDATEDGAAFLVMELLEGKTLDELWEQNGQRLPLQAVVSVGVMLLDVLSAAHAAGVVHRDIKPANLFLTHAWELKILDFGISRLAGPQSSTATQTGMMLGSPAFMAPEQALGRTEEIDGRTDLWSVAASLYTLASGRFVHEGQTAQEMLIRAATTPVRSFATALPEAPALLVAVVDRALAFGRTERWATASEMGVALSEAARVSFGEEPSAGTFAAIVPFRPPMSSTPGIRAKVGSFPPPELAPALTGGMTELTSSVTGLKGGPAEQHRRRKIVVGGIGALGALVGLAVLLARGSHDAGPAVGVGGIAASAAIAAPVVSQTVDTEAAGARSSPLPTVAVSALPVAATASPSAPQARALPATSNAAPTNVVSRSAPTSRPASPTRPARPGAFLPSPNSSPQAADPCNPPYRSDFFGNKVLKPGCSAP